MLNAGIDPASVSPTLLGRVRVITVGTLAMFLITIPFIFKYWAVGYHFMSYTLVGVMAFCLANIALLRHSQSPDLAGWVCTATAYSLLVVSNSSSGGFYDPNFGWLYVVPLLAAVAVGLRAGWIWVGVVALTTLAFWILPLQGIEVPDVIPADEHAVQSLANRLSAIVAIGILSTSLRRGSARRPAGPVARGRDHDGAPASWSSRT